MHISSDKFLSGISGVFYHEIVYFKNCSVYAYVQYTFTGIKNIQFFLHSQTSAEKM